MKHFLLLLTFLLSFSTISGQQTKKELQKKNLKLKQEIIGLNKELTENAKESKTSFLYIKTLQEKISVRSRYINGIKKEQRHIEDEIYTTQLKINKFNRELFSLKDEYKDVLIKAYKHKSVQNKLLFILSSKSLNQAFRRVKYLQRYSDYRKEEAEKIMKKQKSILFERKKKERARNEKDTVLQRQSTELAKLDRESAEQNSIIAKFEANKGSIITKINSAKKGQKKLDQQIEALIKAEIIKAQQLAKIEAEKRAKEAQRLAEAKRKAEAERRKQETIRIAKEKVETEARERLVAAERARVEAEKQRLAAIKEAKLREEKARTDRSRTNTLAKREAADEQKERERLSIEANKRAVIAKRKNEEAVKAARLARERETVRIAELKKQEDLNRIATRNSPSNLSAGFVANQGRLPWPVQKGTVIAGYGKVKHPILNVYTNNPGIDIATNRGAHARASFKGKVSAVYSVSGGGKAVLIQHGSYYTVYNNLSSVFVKKGDILETKQNIGRIRTDGQGNTILKFQVWRGAIKQNPAYWLYNM